MDPVFTEVEFEKSNDFQSALYQSLKNIPSLILYRECIDDLERLAVVVLNDKNLSTVLEAAKEHGAEIKSIHDIDQSRLEDIEHGDYENHFDGFDSRDGRFWTGLAAHTHFNLLADKDDS
jgi:hypothetical protein